MFIQVSLKAFNALPRPPAPALIYMAHFLRQECILKIRTDYNLWFHATYALCLRECKERCPVKDIFLIIYNAGIFAYT